jgi:rubrerythrin
MPSFPNPFTGNVEREINKRELVQALRIDIAGELEAIFLYDAHVAAATDPLVKKVLADIRDEEKAHVGELMALIRYLEPEAAAFLSSGEAEVKEMMEELGIKEPALKKASAVGSLIEE